MQKLKTYIECYTQALNNQPDYLPEKADHIDPSNMDMPCCADCIYFDGAFEIEDWGICKRYPKRRRVEEAGICGEFYGLGVFVEKGEEKQAEA